MFNLLLCRYEAVVYGSNKICFKILKNWLLYDPSMGKKNNIGHGFHRLLKQATSSNTIDNSYLG